MTCHKDTSIALVRVSRHNEPTLTLVHNNAGHLANNSETTEPSKHCKYQQRTAAEVEKDRPSSDQYNCPGLWLLCLNNEAPSTHSSLYIYNRSWQSPELLSQVGTKQTAYTHELPVTWTQRPHQQKHPVEPTPREQRIKRRYPPEGRGLEAEEDTLSEPRVEPRAEDWPCKRQ